MYIYIYKCIYIYIQYYKGLKPTFRFKTVLQMDLWTAFQTWPQPIFTIYLPFCGKMSHDCYKKHWLERINTPLWHLMCQLRVSQVGFLIILFCTFESPFTD